MKLKIDDIADLIALSPLPTNNSDKIMRANSGKVYISNNGILLYDVDESLCYAHAIVDHILPAYIKMAGIKFQDIIKTNTYEELNGAGFLNGIPYFKSCIKIVTTRPELPPKPPYKKPSLDEVIKERNIYSEPPLYEKPSFEDVIKYCIKHEKQYNHNHEELNKYYEDYCIKLEKQYNDRLEKLNKYYELYCKKHYEQYIKKCEEIKQQYIDKCKKIEHQNKYLQREYAKLRDEFDKKESDLKKQANNLLCGYEERDKEMIESYFKFILDHSFYPFEFGGNTKIEYLPEPKVLLVEYDLPNLNEIPNIKDFKYLKTQNIYKKIELSARELQNLYDDIIYKITIRSIGEIFQFDEKEFVDVINFNGRVSAINRATGLNENNCILSVQIKRDDFGEINIKDIDAKSCFKYFNGIGSARLSDITAIVPIMEINKNDKRFIDAKNVKVNDYTNLAAISWEDFEQLIRELFDKEFNQNGGEVKVTQSSRDGGVDAIAFDPDPIRGGKIIIQAKRYTNTVGVSAVRDLYGTVINEGANKGILITTSDYGSDSYNFAKGKPITLLNGGHLLFLLEKHGQKARINLTEAKEINAKK